MARPVVRRCVRFDTKLLRKVLESSPWADHMKLCYDPGVPVLRDAHVAHAADIQISFVRSAQAED